MQICHKLFVFGNQTSPEPHVYHSSEILKTAYIINGYAMNVISYENLEHFGTKFAF